MSWLNRTRSNHYTAHTDVVFRDGPRQRRLHAKLRFTDAAYRDDTDAAYTIVPYESADT